MAQSAKHPTLDFSSGHDLTVCGMEPCNRLCADSGEPAWDSLSHSLFTPRLVCMCSLSLSQKKKIIITINNKKKRKMCFTLLKLRVELPIKVSTCLENGSCLNYDSNNSHHLIMEFTEVAVT